MKAIGNSTGSAVDAFHLFYDETIAPLVEAGLIGDAISKVEVKLTTESDPEARMLLFSNLISFLIAEGRHEESLTRARQQVDEFPDDALGWSILAGICHFGFHRPNHLPIEEDISEALRCWRKAMSLASRDGQSFHAIAADFCRALVSWEKWDALERTIREIRDFAASGDPAGSNDRVHLDWMSAIPAGKIDPELKAGFLAEIEQC